MKFRLLIVFLYLLSSGKTEAQKQIVLSLGKAIELAKNHSLDAQLARFRYLGSYWTYRSFQAELLPSATLSGSLMDYSRSTEQVRNYEDGKISYVNTNQLSNSLSLSVTQQIPGIGGYLSIESYLYRLDQFTYDERMYNSQPFRLTYSQPLRSYNTLKWRKNTEPLSYENSRRTYLEQMEDITLKVTSLFFSVLSAQSSYSQSLSIKNERSLLYEQNLRRFELGTISKSELLQLELSQLNADVAVKSNRLELDKARFELFSYLQARDYDLVELQVPQFIPDMILTEEDVYLRAAQNSTYQLVNKLNLLEGERALAEAKSRHGIQMSLHGLIGMNKTGSTIRDVYSGFHGNEVVGLSLSMPLFDWGVNKGKVQIAKSNLEVIKTRIEQAAQEFRQTIHTQVSMFNDQGEQCRNAQRAEQIARERYDLMLQRFKAGSVSVTELNTAQQELEMARIQSIAQLCDFWTSYYSIQKSTLYDYLKHEELTTDFEKLTNEQ